MTMVINSAAPRRIRKKAAARQHIITTAVKLFSRHGFFEVTVDHIADVADLGKGTIYNYFDTKEDIVVAFMVEREREVQDQVSRFQSSRGSLEKILTEFVRFQFQLKKPFHAFVRVFLAQMFLRTEAFLPYMLEMQKAIDPPLEALFRNLQARSLMRKDVDLAELIIIFKTIHLGLTALWAVEGPPFKNTERVLQEEMRLFSEGLKERKP